MALRPFLLGANPGSSQMGLRFIGASFLALIIVLYVVVSEQKPTGRTSYSYVGTDYPLTWDLRLDRVHKATEDSYHYAFNTPLGYAEWNSTLPSGGGILYLGPERQPFSISMFHQLRCLDIIGRELGARASLLAWEKTTPLTTHCMGYLRQMALCRADLRLQSIRTLVQPHIAVPSITNTCNDWSRVYAAAEENYADFVRNRSHWQDV